MVVFWLVFFVVGCFVAIGFQGEAVGPGKGSGHDGDDILKGALVAVGLDDYLVVYMHDDMITGGIKAEHGFGKAVAGNGLNDIFDQLAAVGFDGFPGFGGLVHAIVRKHSIA